MALNAHLAKAGFKANFTRHRGGVIKACSPGRRLQVFARRASGRGRGVESEFMAGAEDGKQVVRRRMKERRAGLSPAESERLSRSAERRLDALLRFMGARRVGIYAAVRGEMDFSPLWNEENDVRRRYYFPRVEENVLRFCPVNYPDTELRPGAFQIPEPISGLPALDANELDAVVAPGLAFDACGGRLGSGGGFYDRALCRPRGDLAGSGPLLVGACYAFQLLAGEFLRRDAWDVDVDWVITDRGAMRSLPREYMH